MNPKNMKPALRLILLLLVFAGFAPLKAQIKVAYLNTDSLLTLMPQYDSVEKKIQQIVGQYQAEIASRSAKLEQMKEDYQKDCINKPPAIQELCQQDIMEAQQKLVALQEKAQGDISQKQQELLTPLIKQLKAAIEAVGKEKGYTLVLTTSTGVILYSQPEDDIFNDVKKKLGVK